MPDYFSILTLYQMREVASSTGAMASEREEVTSHALNRVAQGFLTQLEQTGWSALAPEAQAARLRLGRQRLRRWEMANPDIAALLRRKARAAAHG